MIINLNLIGNKEQINKFCENNLSKQFTLTLYSLKNKHYLNIKSKLKKRPGWFTTTGLQIRKEANNLIETWFKESTPYPDIKQNIKNEFDFTLINYASYLNDNKKQENWFIKDQAEVIGIEKKKLVGTVNWLLENDFINKANKTNWSDNYFYLVQQLLRHRVGYDLRQNQIIRLQHLDVNIQDPYAIKHQNRRKAIAKIGTVMHFTSLPFMGYLYEWLGSLIEARRR